MLLLPRLHLEGATTGGRSAPGMSAASTLALPASAAAAASSFPAAVPLATAASAVAFERVNADSDSERGYRIGA